MSGILQGPWFYNIQSWQLLLHDQSQTRDPTTNKLSRLPSVSPSIAMPWSEHLYPPKIPVEILTPKVMVLMGGVFGRWLGHEDDALMNGISALVKELPQKSLPFPSREDTVRRWQLWTRKEGPCPTMLMACSWTSSFQNCEQSLVHTPPRLWCFVIAAQTKTQVQIRVTFQNTSYFSRLNKSSNISKKSSQDPSY